MSKFRVELRGYSGPRPYFMWRLVSTKSRMVLAEGRQYFNRPGALEKFVDDLFGCNPDVEIWERPGFRKIKKRNEKN